MSVFRPRKGHRRPYDAQDAAATIRIPGWRKRLEDTIDIARTRKFKYGEFDCALFAAECVEAITGTDFAASLRGYHGKAEARALIQAAGSLRELVTQQLGRDHDGPHKARCGDVVIADIPVGEDEESRAIGICLGAMCVFAGRDGVVFHPRSTVVRCWRIE